jgi:multidrug efflux pump subunit AcrA (membrane-fusion protein)
MKLLKITSIILVVFLAVFLSISCSSSSTSTATTKTLTTTVKKGNLSISITGTGNLAYANTESLAFDMAGTVDSVSVSAGDTVKEGQELVKLNTSDWEDQIASLQKALTSAQRNLTNTQASLTKIQRDVSTKELAVKQAELDLESSQNSVTEITEMKKYQDVVDKAQYNLAFAQSMLKAAAIDSTQTANATSWIQQVTYYEQDLTKAQKDLQSALTGKNIQISSDVALQIAKAQFQVVQSQKAVEDAEIAVDDANTAVKNAQLDVQDAAQGVQNAENNLDKTKALSPVIKAPLAGFVTKVNVKGGDQIQKGTVAVQMADPTRFQANILVTENDIFSVNMGAEASVSLDALSGVTYPAKITNISPTATVTSGVVNYSVTVQLTSLQPVNTTQNTSANPLSSQPNGTPPSGTPPAFSPPAGTTTPGINPSSSPTFPVSSQTTDLKDGLSATVKIVQQQVSNALIVPSKAVTHQNQSYTVQVVKGTTTETRTVQIGLTDGSNTEITQGFNEGEQITYQTNSTSSSSSSSRSNSQIGIPGVGGGPPPGGF